MANILGTNVAATVVPFTTDDIIATHDEEFGKGGYRSVSSLSERNAIPANRRKLGMIVKVLEDGKYWTLNVGITNTDWEEWEGAAEQVEYTAGDRITIVDNVISADLQTDNNFTDYLKDKLENIEDPKFRGTFSSLSDLELAEPVGQDGWSANVIVDDIVHLFVWDTTSTEWVDKGAIGADSPEMIKMKYESLPTALVNINAAKLATIEEGAQVNVQSDWDEDDNESDAYIQNKPDLSGMMTELVTDDTDTIFLSGSGTTSDPLKADLYVALEITNFVGGNDYEKGSTVNNVNLVWSFNKPANVVSQSINQGIGAISVGTTSHNLTLQNITANRTYTLTASDGKTVTTKDTTVRFLDSVYYGVSPLSTLSTAQVLMLNSELAEDRKANRLFDCTGGRYFYVAFPTLFGTPMFRVGGLAFSAMLKTTIPAFVNASGETLSLDVYRVQDMQWGTAIELAVL